MKSYFFIGLLFILVFASLNSQPNIPKYENPQIDFKYTIVIGSMHKLENAEKLQKLAIENGYECFIVPVNIRNKQFYRVCVGLYQDFTQSKGQLKVIKKDFKIQNAWIWQAPQITEMSKQEPQKTETPKEVATKKEPQKVQEQKPKPELKKIEAPVTSIPEASKTQELSTITNKEKEIPTTMATPPAKPETPKAEEQPKTQPKPETQKVVEQPKSPAKPETPKAEEQPKTQPKPETQKVVEQPKSPAKPETPKAEEQPKTQLKPETQKVVEQPKPPAKPETPKAEEQPKTPAKPETPKAEEQPKTQPKPETPKAEEQPKTQLKPETQKVVEQPKPQPKPETPKAEEQPKTQPKPETQKAIEKSTTKTKTTQTDKVTDQTIAKTEKEGSTKATELPSSTELTPPIYITDSLLIELSKVLPKFISHIRNYEYVEANKFIHPDLHFYVIYNEESKPSVREFNSFEKFFAVFSAFTGKGTTLDFSNDLSQILNKTAVIKPYPVYDCSNRKYNQSGLIVSTAKPSDINLLNSVRSYYRSFNQDILPEIAEKVTKVESRIQASVIDTDGSFIEGMYFGYINNKWYLLVLDIKFRCR